MITTQSSYSLTVCTSKKYKGIAGQDCYLKTHIQSTKFTLIRMNAPTLALACVIITVHITTYKCRRVIAEVWLSCRVNEGSRQTRERTTDCQAKSVDTHTTYLVINHLLVAWGGAGGILKVDQGASLRHFSIFFCLQYLPLCKYGDFLSDPNVQTSRLEQKAGVCTFTRNRPANPPRLRRLLCWWLGGRWRWGWW